MNVLDTIKRHPDPGFGKIPDPKPWDPDRLFPDPQNSINTDPEPVRIQVFKITKLMSNDILNQDI